MSKETLGAFREVNLSDGKCNVSLYVCAEEEKRIDEDPEYASELFRAALEGKLPSAGDNDSDIESASDSGSTEFQEETKMQKKTADWTSASTWAYINSIKKNSYLLHMKLENRSELYKKVQEELKEDGYEHTIDNIKKKFSNLLTSYTRSKQRAKQSENAAVNWEFFEAFDELMMEVEKAKASDNTKSKVSNTKERKSNARDKEFIDVENAPSPRRERTPALSREDSPVKDDIESAKKSDAKASGGKKRTKEKSDLEEETVGKDKSNTQSKVSAPAKKKKKSTIKVEDEETSFTGDPADHVVVHEADEGFNHIATLLFIDCIRKNKDMLKTKDNAKMFTRIRQTMAGDGYNFTEAVLRKKWYNLLVSYRRILERVNESGDSVTSWPYFEALDSIITGTKAIAQNYNQKTNGISNAQSSSYRANGATPKRSSSKVLDLIATSELRNKTDDDFQRAFLTEWEEREQRREERDIMKLNLLQKIAKSMEMMTRKQDTLINTLKKK